MIPTRLVFFPTYLEKWLPRRVSPYNDGSIQYNWPINLFLCESVSTCEEPIEGKYFETFFFSFKRPQIVHKFAKRAEREF